MDGYKVEVSFQDSKIGSFTQVGSGDREEVHGFYLSTFETSTHLNSVSDASNRSIIDAAFGATVRVASLISDTFKVSQPTVGLAGIKPELESAKVLLNDHWETLVGFGEYRRNGIVSGWPTPNRSQLEHILSLREIEPSSILLAQACNQVMLNPDSTNGPALVLAATACEIKIKQRLVDLSSDDQSELLELLLPEGRPAKLRVLDIVKDVTKAIFGRSLAIEDPQLYAKYGELIKARNAFTHRGLDSDYRSSWTHVTTARNVFKWIDSLP
ncbi:hypothetical protein ABZ342_32520 [Amycolatopsis sp. NPDC005961]|uniref:hypothetical protein n=1 Tax=Amycolatopsis sp. NPDC005961 TaxID=3156720 RepID=UPI0033CE8626